MPSYLDTLLHQLLTMSLVTAWFLTALDNMRQLGLPIKASQQRMQHHYNATSTYCNICMPLTGKGIAGFSRQDMFKQPSGVGVHMTQRVFCLEPCHGLLPGLGMLQNLPSAVVAHVLGPAPGSRVLDMCASPGGGCDLFLNNRMSHVCSSYGTCFVVGLSTSKQH